MKTYYLSDDGTRLALVDSSPAARTNSIVVAHGQESYMLANGRQAQYIGSPGVDGPQHGDYLVTINVASAFKGAQMRVALERAGVFLAGGWSPYRDVPAAGKYTFKLTDSASSDWIAGAVLQLYVQVKNTNAKKSGTVRWTTGVQSSVAAPFPSSPPTKLAAAFAYKES